MRRSEFDRAVEHEFGARGSSLVADLVLTSFGRTAHAAFAEGEAPKDIWLALCAEADVPLERRYGVGRRNPRLD